MKLCRNCRTINTDDATSCVRCKMRDQLVDYNPALTQDWQKTMHKKIKVMRPQNVCKNCGTSDHGNGAKCAKCHFPLSLRKKEITQNDNLSQAK